MDDFEGDMDGYYDVSMHQFHTIGFIRRFSLTNMGKWCIMGKGTADIKVIFEGLEIPALKFEQTYLDVALRLYLKS